jgi:hypothetical protein
MSSDEEREDQERRRNEQYNWLFQIFQNQPYDIQQALVDAGAVPNWWMQEPQPERMPTWMRSAQLMSSFGFWSPVGLAPLYAGGMVQRVIRSGDTGLYTYPGRTEEAMSKLGGYIQRGVEAKLGGWAGDVDQYSPDLTYGQYYQMQGALWESRTSYWMLQQAMTPASLGWSAFRLGSYFDPKMWIVRALGFPFWGMGQQLAAGWAMAPGVQQAMAVNPQAALARISQSSTFWAGQYNQFGGQMFSSFGEWTSAQVALWYFMRPQNVSFSKFLTNVGGISLMQPGLDLLSGVASTMMVRAMWGVPLIQNEQERRDVLFSTLIGGLLTGAGWGLSMRTGAFQDITAMLTGGQGSRGTWIAGLQGGKIPFEIPWRPITTPGPQSIAAANLPEFTSLMGRIPPETQEQILGRAYDIPELMEMEPMINVARGYGFAQTVVGMTGAIGGWWGGGWYGGQVPSWYNAIAGRLNLYGGTQLPYIPSKYMPAATVIGTVAGGLVGSYAAAKASTAILAWATKKAVERFGQQAVADTFGTIGAGVGLLADVVPIIGWVYSAYSLYELEAGLLNIQAWGKMLNLPSDQQRTILSYLTAKSLGMNVTPGQYGIVWPSETHPLVLGKGVVPGQYMTATYIPEMPAGTPDRYVGVAGGRYGYGGLAFIPGTPGVPRDLIEALFPAYSPQYERPSIGIQPWEWRYELSGLYGPGGPLTGMRGLGGNLYGTPAEIRRQWGETVAYVGNAPVNFLPGLGVSAWQMMYGGWSPQYERPNIPANLEINQAMMYQQAVGYYGQVGGTARERREYGGWGGVTPEWPTLTAENQNIWAGYDYEKGQQWGSMTGLIEWAAEKPGDNYYYDEFRDTWYVIHDDGTVEVSKWKSRGGGGHGGGGIKRAGPGFTYPPFGHWTEQGGLGKGGTGTLYWNPYLGGYQPTPTAGVKYGTAATSGYQPRPGPNYYWNGTTWVKSTRNYEAQDRAAAAKLGVSYEYYVKNKMWTTTQTSGGGIGWSDFWGAMEDIWAQEAEWRKQQRIAYNNRPIVYVEDMLASVGRGVVSTGDPTYMRAYPGTYGPEAAREGFYAGLSETVSALIDLFNARGWNIQQRSSLVDAVWSDLASKLYNEVSSRGGG